MMTRKDYITAAQIVCSHVDGMRSRDLVSQSEVVLVRQHLTSAFEALFRADNPRFDAARFREACQK